MYFEIEMDEHRMEIEREIFLGLTVKGYKELEEINEKLPWKIYLRLEKERLFHPTEGMFEKLNKVPYHCGECGQLVEYD